MIIMKEFLFSTYLHLTNKKIIQMFFLITLRK